MRAGKLRGGMGMVLAILGLLLLSGCGLTPEAGATGQTSEGTNPVVAEGAARTDDAVVPVLPAASTATVVASPAARATSTSVPPSPTATQMPLPTATPAPALRQLLSGGCCVNPMWRADGQAIRFLDKPTANATVGIYEVAVDAPAPVVAGTLFTTTLASWAGRGRFYVTTTSDGVTINDLVTGKVTTPPTDGNQVAISPDGTRLAWQVRAAGSGSNNQRQTTFWVAGLDGSEAQAGASLRGGSLVGWLGNGALLLQRTADADDDKRTLVRYDIEAGTTTDLDSGTRFNGMALSPSGEFIVYYISLDENKAQNAIWVMNTTTGKKQQLPVIGGYQWRDATRLLVIPVPSGTPAFHVEEYDAASATLRPLTDPAVLPFRVANNDWMLSPDGSRMVFVSAEDGNLWLLELGAPSD